MFAPQALVHHAVERVSPGGTLCVASRWGAAALLFAHHPPARSMLYGRVFWNIWHYLMWRALLALAGLPWLRRLILTRPLMALRGRAREAGAGASALPFPVIDDLVECSAIARGAVRWRTLVV
jgi:hypothetical protein